MASSSTLYCSLLCLLDEGVLQPAAGLTVQHSDSLRNQIAVGGSKSQDDAALWRTCGIGVHVESLPEPHEKPNRPL
jgi:hypothetical protein